MSPIAKRTLFAMLVVFLLTACASAPVPTPDPASVQQTIEKSVASTVAVRNAEATAQQALIPTSTPTEALQPAETPMGVTESSDSFETLESLPDLENLANWATPTNTASPDEELDFYCKPLLESQLKAGEITGITQPLKSQLKVNNPATIKRPLNLRTQPSLLSRIILVLKPDTQVEIIGGPRQTRYQNGIRYVWWQIELPSGLTGWSAEFSACRQFYFIEPV
jgi:hypothetical protein